MAFQTILYEVRNKVAYVTLNRPDHGNALNETMHKELIQTWERVNADDDVWTVVVQGAGKDFCIGEDAHEIAEAYRKGGKVERWTKDEAWLRKHSQPPIFGWPRPMDAFPAKPTIAAVQGRCHGSGMMFCANAATIIASDDAEFSLPQVSLGTAPMQEILLLSRNMARAPVLGLALLGKHGKWTADRARQLGLLIETHPRAKLQQRVDEVIDMMTNQSSPLAVRAGFLEWWMSFDLPPWERRQVAETYSSEIGVTTLDAKEGPLAFAQKRKPRWTAG